MRDPLATRYSTMSLSNLYFCVSGDCRWYAIHYLNYVTPSYLKFIRSAIAEIAIPINTAETDVDGDYHIRYVVLGRNEGIRMARMLTTNDQALEDAAEFRQLVCTCARNAELVAEFNRCMGTALRVPIAGLLNSSARVTDKEAFEILLFVSVVRTELWPRLEVARTRLFDWHSWLDAPPTHPARHLNA